MSIDGEAVTLDGVEIAKTSAIGAGDRMHKVDALFEALRARHDEWIAAHPDRAFPGVAGLRVADGVRNTIVKSVFQTMAYAGWPDMFIQPATSPEHIVALAAEVPAGGGLMGKPVGRPLLEPTLHLTLEPAGATLTWRKGATLISEQKVARDDLARALCEEWKRRGVHREAADEQRDKLVLVAPNAEPYDGIMNAASAALACERRADGAQVSAFWIQLRVH